MFVKRLCLACFGLLIVAGTFVTSAQAQIKLKEPLWTHAFDLQCRKFGEAEFSPKTEKFGVEVFKDNNNGVGIYISQVGSLAAVNSGFAKINKAIANAKGPDWITGLDLPARKAGQSDFKKATVHSMEVFYDTYTSNSIYVTEKGYLAATAARTRPSGGGTPKLSHSIDLGVRKGGDKEWKDATKFGIEVYSDPSTGNLIYICETGALAVIPEDPKSKVVGDGKDPEWLHGLDLRVRKSTENTFNKDSKTIGVEVYRDGNNGNLVFLTESGYLSVTPGSSKFTAPTTPPVKDPRWTHGMNMRCRKTGEDQFSDTTQAFGVEVFLDENLRVTVYLAETGMLSAVKAP